MTKTSFSKIPKCSTLNQGANGHLIISSIKQGITYKYAAVIDSTMDVLGSFYSSLPTDLEMTESAVEFLLEPLDGMAYYSTHNYNSMLLLETN